jgi:hypothetical protein
LIHDGPLVCLDEIEPGVITPVVCKGSLFEIIGAIIRPDYAYLVACPFPTDFFLLRSLSALTSVEKRSKAH